MNTLTNEEAGLLLKNKRDQYVVQIRKHKNEKTIELKRQKFTSGYAPASEKPLTQQERLNMLAMLNQATSNFMTVLQANKIESLVQCVEQIRRAVSMDDNPPLDELLATGIVPELIKLLDYQYYQYEDLMAEVSWIIANIASGKPMHVHYLMQLEIIPTAMDLIDHSKDDVKDNAVWILANIAGDSILNRDILIDKDIVGKIVNTLDGQAYSVNFLGHISWLISNLCRGKPYPRFEDIQPLIGMTRFLMLNVRSDEVLNNSLWTLSYVSDGSDIQIKTVIEMGVTEKIIDMLGSEDAHMKAPALRTAGNLLTGRDDTTQVMIDAGIIPALSKLLDDERRLFRKEACWGISNIMAGNAHQINEVINHDDRRIMKQLFNLASGQDLDVAKECLICLTNMCSEGSPQQVQILVDFNMIELIVETLKANHDANTIRICLEALENILSNGKILYSRNLGNNPFVLKLAMCEGFGIIENLQNHPDNNVYNMVSRIITEYFDFEQ